MHDYKVEYLKAETSKSGLFGANKKPNGKATAEKLEALLSEYAQNGYELVTVSPITTFSQFGDSAATKTDGLMVTFKKKI